MHTSERDTASAIDLVNLTVSYQKQVWTASAYIDNFFQENVLHPDVQNFTQNRLVPSKSHHAVVGIKFKYPF